MADNKRNGNYKNLLKDWFSKSGYDADITICKSEVDLQNSDTKKYDISFIDWKFHKNINNINSSRFCIMTGNDSIEASKYASKNQYSFVFKPFDYTKFNNIVNG